MYCTKCGRQAGPDDHFCAKCGTRIVRESEASAGLGVAAWFAPASVAAAAVPAQPVFEPPPGPLEDWRETMSYRVVLSHPEVKGLIDQASQASKAGMTGEEFLKLAQPLLKASGAGDVPMQLIIEIAQPMYAKLGIKTGKEARQGYKTSYGRVLAAMLCSMASRKQTLVAIHEGTDGCIVEAEIPSSLTTWKGRLNATLERKAEGTMVTSAAVFEGQAADWGRAKRLLDELHQDILNYRSLQP
jgi:zinc-ribbon domain